MNSTTVRNLLVRGMLAGLVAGALVWVVAYLLAEPLVDEAIAFEETQEAHGHAEQDLVSRALQSTVGLGTGVLVYGVAFGGIAALAYCFALGRIGRFGPRATALLLAGAGLLAVYVVPFLKYPANPPAVGDPDTLNQRTALFFLMVALSVLLAVGAVILGKRLAPRLGNWNATLAAIASFVLVVGLAYAFLPSFTNEVPEGFSASLLWRYRVATLAIQATMWTAFGLVFGLLAERLLAPRTAAAVGASGAESQATPVTH
ncbi:CbtA family protein [Streptomyces lacrimifluminis]|uniref:Membrane protein n=1 Tax=Streptomyces lacrimifluminis TaxID=1500077 RepID=A0A917KZ58_9ACTN|nr:CbtA family protein [Streptomyces lacrimifluminis]GGJ36654.1 membrane protein [Streptomyces lacrimifluminis]